MDFLLKNFQHELSFMKIEKEDHKRFWLMLTICLLWAYPVFHANIFHQDDIYRALTGNYDWYGLGRPLAAEFSRVFSASGLVLLDVAPLTQILATSLLAYSSYLVYKYFKTNYEVDTLFASLIIFLNPYFLYNLYYRFDSIGMAAGVLFATLAFVTFAKRKRNILLSSGLIFAALACYQPIANLFIGLVSVELLIQSKRVNWRSVSGYLAQRCFIFIIGYIFYYLTIGLIVSSRTTRTSLVTLDLSGLQNILINITEFFYFSTKILMSPSSAISAVIIIFIGSLYSRKRLAHIIKIIPFVIISLITLVISFSGPLFLLESTLIHYRTLPSAYIIFSLLVIFFSLNNKILDKLAIVPLLVSISFSYQLGNTYKNQRDYELNIVRNIVFEVTKVSKTFDQILVSGVMPIAPNAKNTLNENVLIRDMVKPAKSWQLDGLLISTGLNDLPFLWGGDKRALERKYISQICADPKIIFDSSAFQIIESQKVLLVLVEEKIHNYCIN